MKRGLFGVVAAVVLALAVFSIISPWNVCDLVPDSLKEMAGCPASSGGGGSGAGME